MTAARLVRHSAAFATAGLVAKIAALATVPVFTRLLGAEAYGLSDLATTSATMLALVARFGGDIPTSRARALAKDRRSRRSILGNYVGAVIATSVTLALLLWPLSSWIEVEVWRSAGGGGIAGLALLLVPITAIQQSLMVVIRLERSARTVVALQLLDLFAHLAAALLFVVLGLGAAGLVAGFVLGGLVGATSAAWVARSDVAITWRPGPTLMLVQRGLPFLPAFVAFVAADAITRIATVQTLGPVATGQLALAFRIASVMALVVSAFSIAWAPVGLSLEHSQDSARTFRRVLTWYLGVSLLASVAAGAMAPEAVTVLSGDEFMGASVAIPGLLWAAALIGSLFVLTTAAGVAGKGPAVAIVMSLCAIVQVGSAVALIEGFGIAGIALSAIIGRTLATAMLMVAVRHTFSAPLVWPVLALAVAGAAAWGLQELNRIPAETLPVRIAIGGAAGLAMLGLAFRFVAVSPRWQRMLRHSNG